MSKEAVVVFTAKSIETLLKEGGSSAWRLDRNHARRCEYVVCTRNAHAHWTQGTEEHHSAFLVGKIRDVVSCPPTPENDEAAGDRYLIQFSGFARVNIANVWAGDRNPVKYKSLDDLGIDFSKLEWEAMPEQSNIPAPSSKVRGIHRDVVGPLTMSEAKKGLSLTFNVPPESIEITIRG